MKSYAEREVYSEQELSLWHRATQLVSRVQFLDGDEIRCHELARAVGRVLALPYSDGRYGSIDHTWLRVGDWRHEPQRAKILDVYVPGGVPQVQLIHYAAWSLPHWRQLYRQGVEYERTDIDEALVERLARTMTESEKWVKHG